MGCSKYSIKVFFCMYKLQDGFKQFFVEIKKLLEATKFIHVKKPMFKTNRIFTFLATGTAAF